MATHAYDIRRMNICVNCMHQSLWESPAAQKNQWVCQILQFSNEGEIEISFQPPRHIINAILTAGSLY